MEVYEEEHGSMDDPGDRTPGKTRNNCKFLRHIAFLKPKEFGIAVKKREGIAAVCKVGSKVELHQSSYNLRAHHFCCSMGMCMCANANAWVFNVPLDRLTFSLSQNFHTRVKISLAG